MYVRAWFLSAFFRVKQEQIDIFPQEKEDFPHHQPYYSAGGGELEWINLQLTAEYSRSRSLKQVK